MPGGLVLLGTLVWSASFLKVIAMAFQLRALIKSRSTKGASLGMLLIISYVQAIYACSSYQAGQWALFWGMLFTLFFTVASAGFVIYLRYIRRTKF